MTNKVTKPEHIKKIGFLSGVNMKISLNMRYLKYLEDIIDIDQEIIEVRKEVIY